MRRLAPVLGLSLAVVVFVACGGGGDDEAGATAGASGSSSGAGGSSAGKGGTGGGPAGSSGSSGASAGSSGASAGTGGAGGSTSGSSGKAGASGTAGSSGVGGASGTAGAAGLAGAAGTSGTAGTGGGGAAGAAGSGGGKLSCNADATAVVDAGGAVVKTCAATETCLDGGCIDACAAAAKQSSNLGCSFWAPTPRTIGTKYPMPSLEPCFAVFLANNGKVPATLGVSRGGSSFDVTKFARVPVSGMPPSSWPTLTATGLPVGGVAVLFLSADPNAIMQETGTSLACPVATAVAGASGVEGPGIGKGFHVTASAPLAAYDSFPFGGAVSFFPSAQTLFPEGAWGTSYVVLGPPVGTAGGPGPMFGQVLAAEDGTEVTIAPTVDLPAAGTIPAIAKGAKGTFTLNAGEYVQWEWPATAGADWSGSVLASTKPVAVTAGNRFLRLQPQDAPGGEASHNQLRPVATLGFSYAVAPFETRRKDLAPEVIPYRLMGTVDGTTLTFDPAVPGAPSSLAKGQIVDFTTDLAFRVASQDADHPFAVAQMMTTANVPSGSRDGAITKASFGGNPPYPLGDEEFVPLIAPDQFRSSYVFFDDPSYATTNLTLIRRKGGAGFADVTIECAGKVTGWKPIGTSGEYEHASIDLVRGGVAAGTCAHGRQSATSTAPFGLLVWGIDTYASYGYLAGGNAAKLTSVDPKP